MFFQQNNALFGKQSGSPFEMKAMEKGLQANAYSPMNLITLFSYGWIMDH